MFIQRPSAVICPVYNEPETWRSICEDLLAVFDLVIVVDDGSQQPIEPIADRNFVLIRNPENLGKGEAIMAGIRHALRRGCKTIGTIDSDGEHDPRNFFTAFEKLSEADLVTVSRGSIYQDYSFLRRWRNQLFSKVLSRELGFKIEDSQSGQRLLTERAAQAVLACEMPPGYAVETQTLRAVVAAGLNVAEVPLEYPGEERAEKRLYNLSALASDVLYFLLLLFGISSLQRQKSKPQTILESSEIRR